MSLPDERYTAFACGSWLLDPQLREYLPRTPTSSGSSARHWTTCRAARSCNVRSSTTWRLAATGIGVGSLPALRAPPGQPHPPASMIAFV
ncbi:hypothetical protein [Micromonospora profundi]|uniref:hypothetical protein n=1 Tax=Micromonospora profundi TaxID=1420889 RepID=UPI0036508BEB